MVEDSADLEAIGECLSGQRLSGELSQSAEPLLRLIRLLRYNIPESKIVELEDKLNTNKAAIQRALTAGDALVFLIDAEDTSDLVRLRSALGACGKGRITNSSVFDFTGLYEKSVKYTNVDGEWISNRPLAAPFSQLRIVLAGLSERTRASNIQKMSPEWLIIDRP